MINLQELADKCTGNECQLSPGIYYAPLKLSRPCKIYGNGSIIICSDGKWVTVEAGGVELHDLNIEAENKASNAPVIVCREDTVFHNVVVKGNVNNCGNPLKDISISPLLKLGSFRSGTENVFQYEVIVSEDCNVSVSASDLTVYPTHLKQGRNIINITTGDIWDNVVIHSRLRFEGRVIRETIVWGRSLKDADVHNAYSVPVIQHKDSFASVNDSPTYTLPPDCPGNKFEAIKRGQRITLDDVNEIKVQLAFDRLDKKFDIDGYAFILNSFEKVSNEQNMIYWGNVEAADKSLRLSERNDGGFFTIFTDRLTDDVKKIVICYSIYGDNSDETFKYVHNPYIRIFVDGVEGYRFMPDNLELEKTINAIEIYNHKGKWKINCVGFGYRSGLKKMCEDYGLEVEN